MSTDRGQGGRLGPGHVDPYTIETHIPGDPAAFHAVADYLRTGLAAKIDTLGEDTAAHRSALHFKWEGEAGNAFVARSGRLVVATDNVGLNVRIVADELDTLGDVLRVTQEGLARLRAEAPSMGLRIEGTTLRPPEDLFFDADDFSNPRDAPFLDPIRVETTTA